ncbi:RNA recognition motif containing protein [Sporothrix schenckii 1099-18]|uniref:RNA recognition motif containing protein n=1 Tax=Sporothrix schenckii 1099-18 TaxID=1397361 RepID=A0A0F2MAM6_SPOSC|nr:RNA recognition motif containing protein [Sporothrix schenckii 1099-18]KJR85216.1 RNA recognition motif containing protein [Sporothrix schenckii 1099-18]
MSVRRLYTYIIKWSSVPEFGLAPQEELVLQSVRRAVLRSAASASAQVVRSTSTSSTPLVRSVAAKAVRMPVNNLALAARYFSQTARVAEEAEQLTSDSVPATASVGETNVEAQDPTPYGIFIRNVVFDASDANLREAFEHYGPINSTFIARDPRGMSKGFGFVYFETAEAQTKALEEANGSFWHGRRLSVQPRFKRQPRQADPNRPPRADDRAPREPSNCLYIGNLPYETTDADLTVTFREVDGLQAVRVAVDRATGWPRGFAHADFDSIESAKAAFEYLKDKQVGSRTLRIDYASPTKYFAKRNSSEDQEGGVSEATN